MDEAAPQGPAALQAEAVLAGVSAGDLAVFEPDAAHWAAVWKPSDVEPHTGHDYWNVEIDVRERIQATCGVSPCA